MFKDYHFCNHFLIFDTVQARASGAAQGLVGFCAVDFGSGAAACTPFDPADETYDGSRRTPR